MYFEGRELKTYAEPVSSVELEEGQVYFAVNFVDSEMLIPIMRTLVFVGRNLESGDVGQVYFQDFESYQEGFRFGMDSKDCRAEFEFGSEDELNHIFHFEKALDILMECSLRRRNKDVE